MRLFVSLRISAIAFFSVGTLLSSQSAPATIYAESFRQGTTHIAEESFDAKLTSQEPVYRERLKDSHGTDHYTFSITPQLLEGDSKFTAWIVKLSDLRHPIYDNILPVSVESSEDPNGDPKNALWRLDPLNFARLPLSAKRIIKVDGFYVVLEVKDHHFTPPDSPYLDSMTVAVEFTNTDPREAKGTEK